jgi:hypothetical protein
MYYTVDEFSRRRATAVCSRLVDSAMRPVGQKNYLLPCHPQESCTSSDIAIILLSHLQAAAHPLAIQQLRHSLDTHAHTDAHISFVPPSCITIASPQTLVSLDLQCGEVSSSLLCACDSVGGRRPQPPKGPATQRPSDPRCRESRRRRSTPRPSLRAVDPPHQGALWRRRRAACLPQTLLAAH